MKQFLQDRTQGRLSFGTGNRWNSVQGEACADLKKDCILTTASLDHLCGEMGAKSD